MRAMDAVAAPLERLGVAKVACPWCGVACAAPAGRTLERVACCACLQSLAPAPAERAQALDEQAGWWDRSRVPGRGYAAVACPSCEAPCVVPVGAPLGPIGCAACLLELGDRPLVRFDLASEWPPTSRAADGALDPFDCPDVSGVRLSPAA